MTPLIYKIKTKAVSGVACRFFVSRLACKITGAKKENNVWEIDLEDATPEAAKTVAEWLAEKDKPKEEPKAEEMMMEGEKMEEMMMEAPME